MSSRFFGGAGVEATKDSRFNPVLEDRLLLPFSTTESLFVIDMESTFLSSTEFALERGDFQKEDGHMFKFVFDISL